MSTGATPGVPLGLITAGDELGRTQHGNNNAYCQDQEASWVDWSLDETGRSDLDRCVDFIRHYHAERPLKATEVDAIPLLSVQAATRFWLSRALAVRDTPPQDTVTLKDPGAMKRLVRQYLDARVEFGHRLKNQLS